MSTKKIFLYLLTFILAAIPFFWLKPGELNLGGDSSRGYIYQPWLFITNYALYGINPWNIATEMAGYFLIPFSAFLGLVLVVVKNSHNLINFFNSFTLIVAFLATFGSVYYLLIDADTRKNYGFARTAAIIAGLFYIFSPNMTNWDKPLLTFNQLFLDPLIFFFFYRYLSTKKVIYALAGIFVTFVFAPNFSFIGAPSFFSFYPFVIICFILLSIYVKRFSINYKQIFLLFLLLVATHAFQLVPQIILIANPKSVFAERVFSQEIFSYVEYFHRIGNGVLVANNFLGLPQFATPFNFSFFVFPFVLVLALWQKVKDGNEESFRKEYLLFLSFFLILLFFVSAKITSVGFEFYANLFKIPGFGMFRHFNGQFMTSFTFFYAIVIGFALYTLFQNIAKKVSIGITLFIFAALLVRGFPLLNGSMLYLPILQTKIASPFVMPPAFDEALQKITDIKTDAKVLALPLNDFGYLMIPGQKGGLYIGSSVIGAFTLKPDFNNYDGMSVFGKSFIGAVKANDTATIRNVLGYLNIQNIFWVKDPSIYDQNFPSFPYSSTQQYISTNVASYQNFVNQLNTKNKIQIGKNYELMDLDDANVLPKIYPSEKVVYTKYADEMAYIPPITNNQPVVVLPYTSFSPQPDSYSLVADQHNSLAGLNDNLQFHIAIPEVSWKPGSMLYPFVIWKEKKSLNSLDGVARMTTAYLYLAKRVEELHKWGNDIPVLGNEYQYSDVALWNITKSGQYNSWEAVFNLYETDASMVVQDINGLSSDEVISQKIIAQEQFEQHRFRVAKIINDSSLTAANKSYLFSLNNKMFDGLLNKINVEKIDTATKEFTTTIPKQADGLYEVHVSNDESFDNYLNLQVNGNSYQSSKADNNTLSFGQVQLNSQNPVSLKFQVESKNLLSDIQWVGLGTVKSLGNIDTLSIGSENIDIDAAMIKELPFIPSSQQYILSFYYKTNNVPFTVELQDKRFVRPGVIDTHEYSKRTLLASDWKLYQTVYTIDPQTKTVFLQVLNDGLQGRKDIVIRDLTLTAVQKPIVTLNKVNSTKQSSPHITFQRVNLTKYKIEVTNATKPYVLTFLQGFSNNWKIYLNKEEKNNTEITKSYFDGLVTEGGHTNTFLDSNILETWRSIPIADSTHTTGDGYANSWVITPSDTQGSTSYELILELKSQQYFYIGSVVTVFSIVILLIWTGIALIRAKKSNE